MLEGGVGEGFMLRYHQSVVESLSSSTTAEWSRLRTSLLGGGGGGVVPVMRCVHRRR